MSVCCHARCREFENFPEGEISEMVDLYMQKGFTEEDARTVITTYTGRDEYKDAFIDHMMTEELGYIVPKGDEASRLWLAGLATGLSFFLFGSVPLWMVAALHFAGAVDFGTQVAASASVTIIALFILGIFKVRLGGVLWSASFRLDYPVHLIACCCCAHVPRPV
jgi:DNA damage-binding protein 1